VVINADSMQVYQDLRTLTARPSKADEACVPHALYGHVDGATPYCVTHYLRDAERTLAQVWNQGQLPIFVGGTGLYFKALLEGLSPIPSIPLDIRQKVRAQMDALGPEPLYIQLQTCDPLTASVIHPTDHIRIGRALEVFEATGHPLVSFWQSRDPGLLEEAHTLRLFLAPERDRLYSTINRRVELMCAAGAVDEVRTLMARKLDSHQPIMRAHGVPWLTAYDEGSLSFDEALAFTQRDTRRYAKRQFTWFRHSLPGWHFVTRGQETDPWDAEDLLKSFESE
jgi:tRNA dimethylallyltransferase